MESGAGEPSAPHNAGTQLSDIFSPRQQALLQEGDECDAPGGGKVSSADPSTAAVAGLDATAATEC